MCPHAFYQVRVASVHFFLMQNDFCFRLVMLFSAALLKWTTVMCVCVCVCVCVAVLWNVIY